MTGVYRIEWTFHTSGAAGAGTDARVMSLMLRDLIPIANVSIEPGETDRLDRGENRRMWWTFEEPNGFPASENGIPVPYTVKFPDGVSGHLRIFFTIHGDDAWRIGLITSQVFTGSLEYEPIGRNDRSWVDRIEDYTFNGEDVLSTNPSEGIRTISLIY